MTLRALAIVGATMLVTAPSVRAECFVLTATFVMQEKDFELVLAGTVVEITRTGDEGYRATFEVERVWKGSAPKRFELYVWEAAPEVPQFYRGQRTVALAKRMTNDRARRGVGFGTSDAVVFTPCQCSGALDPNIRRDLGAGQPPAD